MMIWLILAAAFLVKIPAFTQPFIGYFASYQAINAMMGEMMLRGGDLLSFVTPRSFHLMEGKPSLHLLYYPFGSFVAATLSLLGGSVAFWGRFQAALFTLLAGLCLAKSMKPFEPDDKKIGWAVLFFSFSPMVLVEGVCFQNEAAALFFLTSSFLLLARKPAFANVLFSGILFSLAMTARLHFMFTLPAFLFLLWHGRAPLLHWVVFLAACGAPVSGWFAWTWVLEQRYPAETATSMFGQTQEGRILAASIFTTSSFYLQVCKTLIVQIMTPAGLAAVLYGFFRTPRTLDVYRIWFLCGLAVIVILPQKTLDHPFYLIAAVPPAAVLAGAGFGDFWARSRKACVIFLGLFILLSLRYYMPPAFSFGGDRAIPAIGQKVKELAGPEDKVIASHGTSNDLLFYSGRTGWAFDLKMEEHPLTEQARHVALKKQGYGSLRVWFDKLRADGARWFVVSEPEVFEAQKDFYGYVNGHFTRLPDGGGKYLIYDLRKE